MESQRGNIMTLSNSIIGVSILAMPFCFKQCGIILAILMLITSSILTRLTCHFLLKSATMARRRTFELLAFHAFGTTGKFVVELGIIGFLVGTCIAFFVIIGDLGPAIIAKMLDIKPNDTLRTSILIGVALFCVMPLGLLKNVDSLHSVSTATIGFYFCLVLKTISESASHFMSGDWMSKVELWRPVGILQCLPIFAMALACQTQLFEIYEIIANPTLEKMNHIVHMAVNICVAVYLCVGFFGYIAFASQQFTGNILMSFSPSMMTDVMKIGFVLSVAFSFPLVIFPCRASLHSLLFKKGYSPYEGTSNYIPESKFKILTLFIVVVSLTIGILIPNIEVVLGLVGSTIGTMICLIFPVTCFICISTKNTNERLVAQILLFVGVIVMVMGTYANLYAMEEIKTTVATEKNQIMPNSVLELDNIAKMAQVNKFEAIEIVKESKSIEKHENIKPAKVIALPVENKMDIRLEPPQPVEPLDDKPAKTVKPPPNINLKLPIIEHQTEIIIEKPQQEREENKQKLQNTKNNQLAVDNLLDKKRLEEVDIDAIKKEDKELQEEEKYKQKELDDKKDLIKTLQKKNEENAKLREVIKKKEESELEAKKKAAKQILEIAKKAIEKLDITNNTVSFNNIKANNEIVKENKINKGIVVDPIASKILKISNSENKIASNNMDANNIPPLPIIKSKIYQNNIFKKKEENLKAEKVEKPLNEDDKQSQNELQIQVDHNPEEKIQKEIKSDIKERSIYVTTIKPNEGVEVKKSEERSVDKQKEIIKESSVVNTDMPINAAKRDILMEIEATQNQLISTEISINAAKITEKKNNNNNRIKRESNAEETFTETEVINDEKCEREEKDNTNTELPLINLITELSKRNVFNIKTHLVDNLKNELKSKSIHLKRK